MYCCRFFFAPTFAPLKLKMMRMKRTNLTAATGTMALALMAFSMAAENGDQIIGQWRDNNHPEKQIEISGESGKYIGRSIDQSGESQKGIAVILNDLVWQEQTNSYKGILIDPDNGDEHQIEIKLIGSSTFQFTVSKFIFSKTFIFNRIAK